jgi:hypothetical protein
MSIIGSSQCTIPGGSKLHRRKTQDLVSVKGQEKERTRTNLITPWDNKGNFESTRKLGGFHPNPCFIIPVWHFC